MATTPAFSPRPITRKSARSFRRSLLPSLKRNSRTFDRTIQQGNFQYLMAVGEKFRLDGWKWNRGADFLFRCLARALDLEDYEEFILRAAKPRRGRKPNTYLAERILWETEQGKTAKQTVADLKAEGINVSIEAVQSYRKTRRKPRQS